MHIAHIIQYIGKDFGGPVAGMAALTSALSMLDIEVGIYTTHRPSDGEIINLAAGGKTYICQDVNLGSFRYSKELWQSLKAAECSLIHSHGLWGDPNRCAAVMARRKGIPHLLSPCGMLEPNALRRSSWKKNLVKILFQDRALREVACLVAKSDKEFQDIRAYGLINPVAVIPNPIPGPECVNRSPNDAGAASWFTGTGKKSIVFLGRIHPVKGVLRLAEAWSRVSEHHGAWELIIAGPDEGGFQSTIEASLRQNGCAQTVRFTGALDDQRKWNLLHSANIFVMPSDFENFGNAIVEALLAGLPVITTTRTPWQVLRDQQAGWLVEADTNAITGALQEALSMDERLLREMGARGQVIGRRYAPEIVAGKMIAVYDWLLGRGDRPDCVRGD